MTWLEQGLLPKCETSLATSSLSKDSHQRIPMSSGGCDGNRSEKLARNSDGDTDWNADNLHDSDKSHCMLNKAAFK